MPDNLAFDSFKQELSRLVDIFHKNVSQYRDQGYDESSLRNDYLNPFWRALGWDTENRAALPQPLRDVQIEELT
jgi:transketolase N-terminal domain/subunit